MERHANKTNVLETIKVPLQRTTKTGRTIFAYLRRSTSKIEQSESLIQQEDGIFSIVKKLWLEKQEIRYFAETYSGFENKRRKKWGEMMSEIDKLKEPCIILARDISRLSRNPTDSQWIMDRLYGDNKHKIKIDKIYTLDYENIKEWNKSTDKDEVHKVLSAWYYDSLDTRRKSIGGILLKLENWEFPYKAPKGLESFMQWTKRVLRQNDKMPFVRKAFEMKVEWITHKEISKYLKKYWEIKLSDRELTDRLFKNTMYIGEYTEKTTWLHYPQSNTKPFLFAEWVPPIKRDLWEKVQRTFGRKNSQYWELQEWDILVEKLRTESWKRMSKYLAKWKYPNYKNTIDKINISENFILSSFIESIKVVLSNLAVNTKKDIDSIDIQQLNRANIKRISFAEWIGDIKKRWLTESDFTREEIISIGRKIYETNRINLHIENGKTEPFMSLEELENHPPLIISDEAYMELALLDVSFAIEQDFWEKIKDIQTQKNHQIDKLKKQKQEIQDINVGATKLLIKWVITEDIYNQTIKNTEKDIQLINDKINEYSEDTEIEKYLGRLFDILRETVELGTNAIQERNIGDMKDDLMKLLEITTVELTVNNKKELKVKLFEVLDRFNSSESSIVEAPSGVEPDYKALQASA